MRDMWILKDAPTTTGIHVCQHTSGKDRNVQAKVLVAKKGSKSIVDHDWLTALKYSIERPIAKVEKSVNSISCGSAEPEKKAKPRREVLS